jgi:hypothetical protein
MANTYTLIASNTVGSGGVASVTFSSIPATYTDLVVKGSVRSALGGDNEELAFQFNSDTSTNYSYRRLLGFGSGVNSANGSSVDIMTAGLINASTTTASTFASFEIYIPNYTSSNKKSSSVDTVSETNATVAYASLTADLWTGTAAITSIKIFGANLANLVQYSTFYLYGIKNS